jgi:hypothetical protein
MDLPETLTRKRQQLADAETLVSSLRGEVETLEKAWEIVKRDQAGMSHSAAASITTAAELSGTPTVRSLIQEIRGIVKGLEQPFSTKEVRERLKALDPVWFETIHYSSISGTMRRMAKGGQLAVVEEGGPGKEATYRLPDDTENLVRPRLDDAADEQETIFGGEK